MLARTHDSAVRRDGMILLVVLAMLTLLAIMGITFVLYTNSQAEASRIADPPGSPLPNANAAFMAFLGQLLYDVADDASGAYSAMRGHSFSRTSHGFAPLNLQLGQTVAVTGNPTGGTFTLTLNGQTTPPIAYNTSATNLQTALGAIVGASNVTVLGSPPYYSVNFTPTANVTTVMTANSSALTSGTTLATGAPSPTVYIGGSTPTVIPDKPFTGIGRLHNSVTVPGGTANPYDDFQFINYMSYFQYDGFQRDPDYLATRLGLGAPQGTFAGQLNPPYTYPDLHNMALAMIRAGDGSVLMPSFHRPWLFNPGLPFGEVLTAPNYQTTNPNWTNAAGKYLTLRPRPIDQLTPSQLANAGLSWPPLNPSNNPVAIAQLINQLQTSNQLFPYPGTNGDVQNWLTSPNAPPYPYAPPYTGAPPAGPVMDSIWMDIGLPVQQLPVSLMGTIQNGSNIVTAITPGTTQLAIGGPVSGPGIPVGTTITAINSNSQVTLSANVQNLTTSPEAVSLSSALLYKALVAPLIIDLDSRVNLNVAGNIVGSGNTHASNQGWGPWEVNFYKIAGGNTAVATQLMNVFLGNTSTTGSVPGRYGPTVMPGPLPAGVTILPQTGTGARPWAGVDYNGTTDPYQFGSSVPMALPGDSFTVTTPTTQILTQLPYVAFPSYSTSAYNNGATSETINTNNNFVIHPSAFNPLRALTGNYLLGGSGLQYLASLLRFDGNSTDVPSDPLYSDIRRLCPNDLTTVTLTGTLTAGSQTVTFPSPGSNAVQTGMLAVGAYIPPGTTISVLSPTQIQLSNMPSLPSASSPAVEQMSFSFKSRKLMTLLSMDLDRIGASPYVMYPGDPNVANALYTYAWQTPTGAVSPIYGSTYPSASPIPFPGLPGQSYNTPLPYTFGAANTPPSNVNSEFDPTTLRSRLQTLLATQQTTNGTQTTLTTLAAYAQAGKLDLNRVLTDYPAKTPSTWTSADLTQAQQAISDRQHLTQDIYCALCVATGCRRPDDPLWVANNPPSPTNPLYIPEYNAARYLAQLAVNMVDFIDQDDYSTPFNWDPTNVSSATAGSWVFGVETPRLVINETYLELDNNVFDYTTGGPATKPYNVNVWVELLNPLLNDAQAQWQNYGQGTSYGRQDTQALLYNTNAGGLTYNNGVGGNTWNTYQLLIVSGDNPTFDGTVGTKTPGQALITSMQTPANTTGSPTFNSSVTLLNCNLTPNANATGPCALCVQDFTTNPTAPTSVSPVDTTYGGSPIATTPNPVTQGFYVVGPVNGNAPASGTIPNPNLYNGTGNGFPVTLASPNMSYNIGFGAATGTGGATLKFGGNDTGTTAPYPSIVLQRLACPGLPPNSNPTIGALPNPLYNPYITVDYVLNNGNDSPSYSYPANRYLFDARVCDQVNLKGTFTSPNAGQVFQSWGRPQPYAAAAYVPVASSAGQQVRQQMQPATPPTGQGTAQPFNTFFGANSQKFPNQPTSAPDTLQLPFNWYPFLDRQLISPMELLMVPSVKPDQFTQLFAAYRPPFPGSPTVDPYGSLYGNANVNANGTTPGVMAPWLDPDSRLHRFLELVQTRNRFGNTITTSNTSFPAPNTIAGFANVVPGGRVPGRHNINGLWDRELFEGVADAQPGNRYYYQNGNPSTPFPVTGSPFAPSASTDQYVDQVFMTNPYPSIGATLSQNNMLMDRSPTPSVDTYSQAPGMNDRPFWSLALGHATNAPGSDSLTSSTGSNVSGTSTQVPNSIGNYADPVPVTYNANAGAPGIGKPDRGLRNTLLRTVTATAGVSPTPLLNPYNGITNTSSLPMVNPYHQWELANKIFNNLTTRSNVFAVWVTIGFFQVTNQTVQPAQLGAQVSAVAGQSAPSRFFALIDRTQLTAFQLSNINQLACATNPITGMPVPTTPTTNISFAPSYTDPTTNNTWNFTASAPGAATGWVVDSSRTGKTLTISASLVSGTVLVLEPNMPLVVNGVVTAPATISSISPSSMSSLTAGMLVSGPGIPAGTTIFSTSPANNTVTLNVPTTSPPVSVTSSGIAVPLSFGIEETVMLDSSGQVTITQPHGAGTVLCRGNPGPWWQTYNPAIDQSVVLYWSALPN